MQADARQAYMQAYLGTKFKTCARLPPGYWPDDWHGVYSGPVVPLVKTPDGNSDAGGMWERHANKLITSLAYKPIDQWKSCSSREHKNWFLPVYVDDCKFAGRRKAVHKAWKDLVELIDMDSQSTIGKYLGCEHETGNLFVNVGT